jgi:IS4 transposase
MVLDAVLSRFAEQTPLTVMAQIALNRVLGPDWIDSLFEKHRERQYTRELLFSTTVDLMAAVALGLQPSVHAAAQVRKDLPVSLAALYDKINNTEVPLCRALVTGSAKRVVPLCEQVRREQAPVFPGYRVRIIDGNHLPASEKRLAPLRSFRGAALPGHTLVVYDPDLDLVLDVVPCEDAYTQERTLVSSLLVGAEPGELWMADRNFSTKAILSAWHQQGVAFVVREHGSQPCPTPVGELRRIGQSETGTVYEQAVEMQVQTGVIKLRRIELHLEQPTGSGETVIRILSNLPAEKTSEEIATLYRRRWSIEGMFQWLESVLHSEVRTLGYPRAALFAFCVAVLSFNVLSAIRAAVEREHSVDREKDPGISLFYVTNEIRSSYKGMLIAVPPEGWRPFDELSAEDFCRAFLELAAGVDPKPLRKHPRASKKVVKKGYYPGHVVSRHLSTARLLASRKKTPTP